MDALYLSYPGALVATQWPPLSLSGLAGRSPLGISWRAASPIGKYALPADSLGLASGATLALSVFDAGFATAFSGGHTVSPERGCTC